LSLFRTPSPAKKSKFQFAAAPLAVALTAALAGSVGAWSLGAAAQPAAIASQAARRPVVDLQQVVPASQPALAQAWKPAGSALRTQRSRPAALDAVLAVASIQGSHKQAVSSAGAKGKQDKARKRHKARRVTPQLIARWLLHRFHWGQRQFRYLNLLWSRESSWNVYALNPGSGAYGIPQAVPGSKMASAGPNWQSNARTQILWGLRYIKQRYGSPEGAWDHELSTGWY